MTTLEARPWYREPWPWILLAIPVATIIAGAITMLIALRGADGVVAEDYYKRGLEIASGSFETAGMIVAPCSIRTLSAIASSAADNLLVRAADVQLKERRRLVLMVRETPLHLGHLRAMVAATEIGAIIAPPVPAFYRRPDSVAAIVDHLARRAIDLLALDLPALAEEWAP